MNFFVSRRKGFFYGHFFLFVISGGKTPDARYRSYVDVIGEQQLIKEKVK